MIFAYCYFFCGVGVTLALQDDNQTGKLYVKLFVFLVCILMWPMLFMFVTTTALRAIAEGKPSSKTMTANPAPAKDPS